MHPNVTHHPVQDNAVDCGMCVLGFALFLALQLGIDRGPATLSHFLRWKWHVAKADGIGQAILLTWTTLY